MQLLSLLLALVSIFYIQAQRNIYCKEFSKGWSTLLKAVCAILIVLHHVSKFPKQWYGNEMDFGMKCFAQLVPLSPIIVGVFFFISGYGLMYSVTNKSDYLKDFGRKRLTKILIPWLLITLVNIALYETIIDDFNFVDYLGKFWNEGEAYLFGWFIPTLILFYIIFWQSYKIKDYTRAAILVTVMVLAKVLFCIMQGYGGYWWISDGCFPLGVWYYIYQNRVVAMNLRKVTLELLAFLLAVALVSINHGRYPPVILPEMVCLVIVLLSYNYKPIHNKIISFLSNISYDLFLVHTLFLFAAERLYTQIELPFFVWVFLILTASILGAWLYHGLCNEILRKIIK